MLDQKMESSLGMCCEEVTTALPNKWTLHALSILRLGNITEIKAQTAPGFANSLARFGLGKERWIKIFKFLALRQEQPLCTFLQSAVKRMMTK